MKFVFDWFCSEYAVQNVLHPEKVNDIYFIHSKMYWNPEDDLYQNSAANPEEEPSHDGVPFEQKMEKYTAELKEQMEEGRKLDKNIKKSLGSIGIEL